MPYNPGIQDRSGELLGRGIEALGAGIGQGIKLYQEKKQEKELIDSTVAAIQKLATSDPEFAKAINLTNPSDTKAIIAGVKMDGGGNAALGAQMTRKKIDQFLTLRSEQRNAQILMVGARAAAGGGDPFSALPKDTPLTPELVKGLASLAGQAQDIRTGQANEAKARAEAARIKAGGGEDTAAMRETETIIRNEISAGKLSPDQKTVAARRAALIAGGARDETNRFDNAGTFVERTTGTGAITAVKNRGTGVVGVVDKDGKFEPLDMQKYKPSTLSDANILLNEEGFKKLADSVVSDEQAIKAINRYATGLGGISQGVEKLADRATKAIKSMFTKEPLTEEELALGLEQARQQRLLGVLRTTILGPGVLTETDAQRILDATGGGVEAVSANPEVMKAAIAEILQDKMAKYEQDLDVYNAHVVGRYGTAGYRQRARVQPFSIGASASPAQPPAAPSLPSAAAIEAELARRQGAR